VKDRTPLERIVFMVCLVIAGEAVFSLPFHVIRNFRPVVLEAFALDNLELGQVFAAYGVVAMVMYFPGGTMADRFEARSLLAASLVTSGIGGAYYATFPDFQGLWLLFGFWGVTTILLFWAALIRACREWGGNAEQARGFGILDGGRGLLAWAMAKGAVLLFKMAVPAQGASAADERAALAYVIWGYSAITVAAGVLVFFFVPKMSAKVEKTKQKAAEAIARVKRVVKMPAVWLHAVIIVSAYVAFKGFDNYGQFCVDAWGMSTVEAAEFTSDMMIIRPIAAIGAGFIADRFRSSSVIIVGFLMLVASEMYFAVVPPEPAMAWVLWLNVIVASSAMFGLRGIYFALLEEADVPATATGTAVGLVSVIGYTPDVFVGLVQGYLLKRAKDAGDIVVGHQEFFWFLSAFAVAGLLATFAFQYVVRCSTSSSPREMP
jgi:nitrate/nitrite transporter NarK